MSVTKDNKSKLVECMDKLWNIHSKLETFQHPEFQKMSKELQSTIESLENLTKDYIIGKNTSD